MNANDSVPMVQMLTPEGDFAVPKNYAEYGSYIERLTEEDFLKFYRDMARCRRFDNEATALQRQGQLGLWIPAVGQEAAQIGSGYAVGHNDHIFPSYREHGVAITHGVELMSILKMLRGVNHGGWNPDETRFHLYGIVLGSQVLHATGYAMGVKFDGKVATGNKSEDLAVISYFGDGATAEGDISESFLFAANTQSPIVFFCQNNQWAISSPTASQTRVPLYRRGEGFGVPGIRIDGNDVLASYAVTAKHMDDAREGAGPFMIEALTYRIGAHTSSDDPTKYRTDEEVARDVLEVAAVLQPRARRRDVVGGALALGLHQHRQAEVDLRRPVAVVHRVLAAMHHVQHAGSETGLFDVAVAHKNAGGPAQIHEVNRLLGIADDHATHCRVIRNGVDDGATLHLNVRVENLEGGHDVVDCLDDILEGRVRAAEVFLQDVGKFNFDAYIREQAVFDVRSGVPDHVIEDDTVVGFADSGGVLHHLRGETNLVADDLVASVEATLCPDALNRVRVGDLHVGVALGQTLDHSAGLIGGEELVGDGNALFFREHGCTFQNRIRNSLDDWARIRNCRRANK